MKKMGPIRDPSLIREARNLRELGLSYCQIAKRLGVEVSTAHRWADPEYAEKRRLQNYLAREARFRRTGLYQ